MTNALADLREQVAALAADLPQVAAATARPNAMGAEILIEGVIGYDVTVAGVRAALSAISDDAPVTLRVNSPGGYATEGFGIFNLLAQRRGPVTARVDGVAASAASYILMAASRIEMPEAAMIMIHNASLITIGTREDHVASAEYLSKIDAMMVRIYAARTGAEPAAIIQMMDDETWMDGPEALAAGFIDAVLAPAAKASAFKLPAPTSKARELIAGFMQPPAAIAAWLDAPTNLPITQENAQMTAVAPPEAVTALPAVVPPAVGAQPAPVLATAQELGAIAQTARLGVEWVIAQAEANATIDQARASALDALAAASAAATRPSTVRITRDEGDTRRTAMEAALAMRAGRRVTADERSMAGGMAGWRLLDFARASVEASGGQVGMVSSATIAQAALGLRQAMAAVGLHASTDFPLLLANTASKSLRQAYDSSPRTFLPYSQQAILPDFKSVSRIALGGAPQLGLVVEGGEIEFGTVGEAAESYRVFRYGRRISVTFEAVVNDDLSGFARIPVMFGAAAARLESDTVYGILNSNPNMADAVALFAAGHNNIGTGALSVPAMGAGRSIMRKQTAPNGDILNLLPNYLVVPAELETTALSLMTSTVVPSAPGTNNVNPYAGQFQVIVEPRLTSALQWYMMANSDQIDTIEYAYLAGMETPQVTSYTDEDTDGVVLKATHCFGAKAIDWRGMYRSTGA